MGASVINRALVLVVLAGFITAVYALIAVFLGGLAGSSSDGLVLPIAATAVVAVAFEPVRHLSQSWADRLVYGRRSSPYQVLSTLTEQLASSEPGEGILTRVATLLRDGTGADRAAVWMGEPGAMAVGAVSPPESATVEGLRPDDDSVFLVRHDGAVVGALEVVKPAGSALSSIERSLVGDLAGSVGLVLGYQRLNDSLAKRAREVDESRHRLVEAEDSERRRLERELRDGAQHQLRVLAAEIETAREIAARRGATDLAALLAGLGEETQAAVEEISSLARGIYPPVLEGEGLLAAISALADGAPVPVIVDGAGLGRYPAEIEAAVYFNVSEAVTNAIKHGSPPIRVDLVGFDDRLRFEVIDSGSGFDVAGMKPGSGMNNMSDRLDALGGELTVESNVGSGTTIRGEVPTPVKGDGKRRRP